MQTKFPPIKDTRTARISGSNVTYFRYSDAPTEVFWLFRSGRAQSLLYLYLSIEFKRTPEVLFYFKAYPYYGFIRVI